MPHAPTGGQHPAGLWREETAGDGGAARRVVDCRLYAYQARNLGQGCRSNAGCAAMVEWYKRNACRITRTSTRQQRSSQERTAIVGDVVSWRVAEDTWRLTRSCIN